MADKAIIWDLDGTLYPYNDAFTDSCNRAAAQTMVALGLDLTFEAAYALACQSLLDHHSSCRVFEDRYGLTAQDWHFGFHDRIDESLLSCCALTKSGFERVNGVSHAVLTMGSRNWATRALETLRLHTFFPPNRIFGREDFQFHRKSDGEKPFRVALDGLGAAAADAVMVEDSLPNLVIPKRMGMTTVYLHGTMSSREKPDYVDYVFTDLLSYLDSLS